MILAHSCDPDSDPPGHGATNFRTAALLGVVNAFDIPGRQSFLVDMVGRET
jgi:hypothetical protein